MPRFDGLLRLAGGVGADEASDSWDAATCNQGLACRGGRAGLLHCDGGNGWNGGGAPADL